MKEYMVSVTVKHMNGTKEKHSFKLQSEDSFSAADLARAMTLNRSNARIVNITSRELTK